jgi:hypothetical protein
MWEPYEPARPEDQMAVDLVHLLARWQRRGITWDTICRFLAKAVSLAL